MTQRNKRLLITGIICLMVAGLAWHLRAREGGQPLPEPAPRYASTPEPHEYALAATLGLLGFAVWRRHRT